MYENVYKKDMSKIRELSEFFESAWDFGRDYDDEDSFAYPLIPVTKLSFKRAVAYEMSNDYAFKEGVKKFGKPKGWTEPHWFNLAYFTRWFEE